MILDEPSNGLDPPGIVEMRNLLRGLAAEGHTVFVSSHLLAEVQQMCDHVAIIANGRCVSSGSVHESLQGANARFRVRVAGDPARAAELLERAGFVVTRELDGMLAVGVQPEEADLVTKTLAEGGIYLSELSPIERTLDEVFIETTRGATLSTEVGL
jgi:ABC-2 type transport system ATP-binding protein